jgi:hypothetical protein
VVWWLQPRGGCGATAVNSSLVRKLMVTLVQDGLVSGRGMPMTHLHRDQRQRRIAGHPCGRCASQVVQRQVDAQRLPGALDDPADTPSRSAAVVRSGGCAGSGHRRSADRLRRPAWQRAAPLLSMECYFLRRAQESCELAAA